MTYLAVRVVGEGEGPRHHHQSFLKVVVLNVLFGEHKSCGPRLLFEANAVWHGKTWSKMGRYFMFQA
jgi:hypothetical protein